MLSKLRERAQSEKGFTLIELLVVILIIGILAAIALPAFLGQRDKAADSSAKSDARNMVSQLESHYTDADTYTGFVQTGHGLSTGTNDGQVNAVVNAAGDGYTITGYSKSGNDFIITKSNAAAAANRGIAVRSCTTPGNAGCPAAGSSGLVAPHGW